jgi:hypothetical protein
MAGRRGPRCLGILNEVDGTGSLDGSGCRLVVWEEELWRHE